MDHDNGKVFKTSTKRKSLLLKNDLYEIIQKGVAKPIASQIKDGVQDITCDFTPAMGKFYIPKKKSKLKVLTIRDLRSVYEENIFRTLPNDLEKQQKLLLRKIKHGYAKDENTRSIALNLLKSNNPISRLSWQMLMNINPEGQTHSTQYILWDGKCIRVNGSKGGRNKFICNYDVYRSMFKEVCRKKTPTKSKQLNKSSLLRASLNIRFKPGPLSKKKHLDYSYQKHHVGEIELVKLPRPGLHIQPSYGTPLEPTVKTFLQNLRQEDGTISTKWAEFAVSMLGKVENKVVKMENENSITFNLNYKYNQNHIIMRQDVDTFQNTVNDKLITRAFSPCTIYDASTLTSEVRDVIGRIVDSVEISLNQDLMYPPFDEPRDGLTDSKREISTQSKEKGKRRYGELDRLDVTVIRLSENYKKNISEPCRQIFCNLGCICDSLECNYNLKDHCGRVDCMFKCKCDFSNYKITDSLDSDCSRLYPGLYYLDQKINDKLSKEEQKFHQTVILTDDKSILLKSNRRNWKTTKKYADFYSSMNLRSEIKNKKILSVVVTKLNCSNIEPWCMVHNLYRCCCKGIFTESLTYDQSKNDLKNANNEFDKEKVVLPVPDATETELINITNTSCPNIICDTVDPSTYFCSRVLPYRGRNHDVEYYHATNRKIIEMEKNDKRLHVKMINIINQSYETEKTKEVNENTEEVNGNTEEVYGHMEEVHEISEEVKETRKEVNNKMEEDKVNEVVDVAYAPFKLDELLFNILQEQHKLMKSMSAENKEVNSNKNSDTRRMTRLPNKTKLVQWLETCYKKYRERLDKGLWKTSLSPPRSGKVALYPWNFILSRYQERKNLFLISKQKPFRIFMAVDTRNVFFKKCVDVNFIPRSHLNGYPVMVRNLINNVTDQNDTFCILCGLSHCWELVGSVTKVNENKSVESDSKVLGDHSEDSVRPLNIIESDPNHLGNHSEDSVHPLNIIKSDPNILVDHSEDSFRPLNIIESDPNHGNHSEDSMRPLVNNESDPNLLGDHSEDSVRPLISNESDPNFLGNHSEDSVRRLNINESDLNLLGDNSKGSDHSLDNENNLENITTNIDTDRHVSDHDNVQVSKWFVMTIENDFIEIQFFRKGFFIKYDSIVRAIVVSRQFGKTVRLSSQKCNDGSNDPQFGLYAVPNMYNNCVFIGPYEKDEPLGIEALRKPILVPSKNITRGLWITVNKMDNAEVINNPLSFMPSFSKSNDKVITFGNDGYSDSSNHTKLSTSTENKETKIDRCEKSSMKTKELVKPVRIRKTDCFKLPLKILAKPYTCIKTRSKITQHIESPSDSCLENETVTLCKVTDKTMFENSNLLNKSGFNLPKAEISPQIKISNISSLCDIKPPAGNVTNNKKPEKGMFVLKPEEINERLALNYFRMLQPGEINESSTVLATIPPGPVVEDSLDSPAICSEVADSHDSSASSSVVEDSHDSLATGSVVENSLDSPAICSPLMSDVYIISDEEDSDNLCLTSSWKKVWISCTNIKNLGWIPGKKDYENKLSFKFPGFASTDFYEEEVAFNKINQVFTRKVYIPKNVTLKWQVVEKEEGINVEDELTLNYLNADFVLTKRGLVHKNSLVFSERKRINDDNNLFGNKKRKVEVTNAYCDNNEIEIEDEHLSDDKENPDDDDEFGDRKTTRHTNVFGDEKKNDDDNEFGDKVNIDIDDVSGDKKKINNDNVIGDEKITDEDQDIFEDKEKIDEYRKVFGCVTPSIASTSTRVKSL